MPTELNDSSLTSSADSSREVKCVAGRARSPFSAALWPERLPEVVRTAQAVIVDGLVVLCVGVHDDGVLAWPSVAGALLDSGVAQGLGVPADDEGAALDALSEYCKTYSVKGTAGAWHVIPGRGDAQSVALLGCGKGTADDVRTAGARVASAKGLGESVSVVGLSDVTADVVSAFATGAMLGGYSVVTAKGEAPKDGPSKVRTIELVGVDHAAAVAEGAALGFGTARSRELCDMRSSIKTPAWMAQQAVERAAEVDGVTVEVFDHAALEEMGCGGLLAVGAEAEVPPVMIKMEYSPEGAQSHVALVGKGITFDTGGLSLKPSAGMELMRTDMSGSAGMLEATLTAARMGVKVKITTLLACAENSFGGASYRPSDVVTIYGGRTVEVANTDAEGRMVLADALAYVEDVVKPDIVVDMATLTGAATMALGRGHAAAFTTAGDDVMADLELAGEAVGEKVWHMPLVEDYRFALDSDTADVRHISDLSAKVGAGSVVAGLFLREFVGDLPWIHLDIAGPGRATKSTPLCPTGPTGFGVRLLTSWLKTVERNPLR